MALYSSFISLFTSFEFLFDKFSFSISSSFFLKVILSSEKISFVKLSAFSSFIFVGLSFFLISFKSFEEIFSILSLELSSLVMFFVEVIFFVFSLFAICSSFCGNFVEFFELDLICLFCYLGYLGYLVIYFFGGFF